MTTLVCEYWKKIGIDANFKTVSFALWDQLIGGNQIRATIHWVDRPADTRDMPAMHTGGMFSKYAGAWGPAFIAWYNSNGAQGIEPPDIIKAMFKDRDLSLTGNDQQRKQAALDLLKIVHDNYLRIGLTQPQEAVIYSDRLMATTPPGESAFMPFVMLVQCYFRK